MGHGGGGINKTDALDIVCVKKAALAWAAAGGSVHGGAGSAAVSESKEVADLVGGCAAQIELVAVWVNRKRLGAAKDDICVGKACGATPKGVGDGGGCAACAEIIKEQDVFAIAAMKGGGSAHVAGAKACTGLLCPLPHRGLKFALGVGFADVGKPVGVKVPRHRKTGIAPPFDLAS